MANTPLPDKPSDLIRLALTDLEAVEKNPKYRVDMKRWHSPSLDGRCSVCLAGAVMAGALASDPEFELVPYSFSDADDAKLTALDLFRTGAVRLAVGQLSKAGAMSREDVDAVETLETAITPYSASPSEFKSDMRRLANMLAEAGY